MQVTRRGSRKPQRRGFTLIELLVVISIIAVLAALILPGINSAREAARRMQCINQMRNVSMAVQSYASANNGALPFLVSDPPAAPNSTGTGTGSSIGVWNGDDGTNVTYDPAPWSVILLPYLENSDLFDRLTTGAVGGVLSTGETVSSLTSVGIQVYTCPDDPNEETGGTLSFAANGGYTTEGNWALAQAGTWTYYEHQLGDYLFSFNGGVGPSLDTREVQAATGVFVEETGGAGYKATIDRMKDGQTQTILLTENLQSTTWYASNPREMAIFAPIAGSAVVSSGPTPATYTDATADANGIGPDVTSPPPNAKSLALAFSSTGPDLTGLSAGINENLGAAEGRSPRPSSNHPNVVNVMYADGHGAPLASTINADVYLRLLSSNGGKFGQQVLSDSSF